MSRVRSSLGSRHLARDRVLGLSANSLLDENGRRLPVNIRTNIGPDRFDLLHVERAAPGRHLSLAVKHRADKSIASGKLITFADNVWYLWGPSRSLAAVDGSEVKSVEITVPHSRTISSENILELVGIHFRFLGLHL